MFAMEKLVVGVNEASGILRGARLDCPSDSRSSPNLSSNGGFLGSSSVRLGGRIFGRPNCSQESNGVAKTTKLIHSRSLGVFLGKDVNDREEVRSELIAWRDGARAWKAKDENVGSTSYQQSSRNSSELRNFLQGYEGWQGEKPAKPHNKIFGRKKKRKYGEKMLKMLKALEENPSIDEALAPWKGLLREDEQGTLLDEQWRCDRAFQLFTWFNELEGYRPNTCHYNIILKKCGRAQKWDLVRNLWSEMQERNVMADSYTYNTLIDVNEKAGRKAEATFWFECSKQQGFLDEVAIGSQINVLKEFGDFQEGNKLFESLPNTLAQLTSTSGKDACEQISGSNGSSIGSEGDVGTCDSAFERLENTASSSPREKASGSSEQCSDDSEHLEAEALKAPPHPMKVDTYNIMMDLHGKAGDLEKASMTFRDMVNAGVDPDIVTYNTMIHICSRAGRVREAKSLFKKISEKGLVPDVASYNTLISMFIKRGEKQKALQYYQKMKTAGVTPDTVTFRILLKHSMLTAEGIGSNLELSKHITSVMEELSSGIGEVMQESELAQTIMLNLYKKAGMKELAVAAAKRIREAGLWTNLVSFNSVLEMSQSLSEAREVFDSMQEKQIIPDISTYNRMAGVFKRVGLYHEALLEIEDADSAGLPLNLHILTTAASLYSHFEMHEEALEACRALRKCGSTLDGPAYNAMIYAFGNAGRVDEAVRISMEMQNKAVKADVITHTTVITVYAKMGLMEGVSRVYKRMKRAQCEPDEVTYKQLIWIYKNSGREDLAAMIFQERQFARYLANYYRDDNTAELSSTDTEEDYEEEAEEGEEAAEP
ncbi:uncharacterized protein [Physcomitrium patens]|uniref:uncharacterized protein isoform X2 n=1 Tax=Physcomitrium patens TaxID=3218 RepID=UPI000D17A812|nr:pentatricopeptide repeat-containing protein At1g73710-like isoform X2 [Physcomitrium patens]|eukprot:XP_024378675.1 pentatricopeptide repeat-containing protein At1g73710-like isoform X2 [Physcomitrella patens]